MHSQRQEEEGHITCPLAGIGLSPVLYQGQPLAIS
jgi:hypothetical protein